jgi:magnesium-transporting ATPase (P-type)
MEYYIVSIIISVVIFGIIFSLDRGTNENYYDEETGTYKKPLFSTNNILLFTIIYIVTTIISYYVFTSSVSLSSLQSIVPAFVLNLLKPPQEIPPMINDNDEIDPKVLRKINDNFDIGFMPNIQENKNEK